ncbi:MAG: hypothetical protein GX201_13885 [Clostridiales bacterium]|jgi:hypothetical protein|nr:hypothetical protein [Clostridiales bacterium]
MSKICRNDYGRIVKVHNEPGMKAAMEYIRENFGTKYPRDVINRIKKSPGYKYDAETKKIIEDSESTEKTIFMDIDELCKSAICSEVEHTVVTNVEDTKKSKTDIIYQELMEEKFLELNKYIRLNRYLNTISIDKTALIANGYQISIY